jgi:transposase
VWHDLAARPELDAAVMANAYASDAMRRVLPEQGGEAVIPSQTNRLEAIPDDKEHYTWRQKVERSFNKRKRFRRIATWYAKLSRTFLAFIHRVATRMMSR